MKFHPQYAIIYLCFDVAYIITTIVKIITWGNVGYSWA